MIVFTAIVNNKTLLHAITANFSKVVPLCLQYEQNSPQSEAISQRLYNFYNLSASDTLSVAETIRGLSNVNIQLKFQPRP